MFVAALRDGDIRVRLTAAHYLPTLLSVSVISRHEHVYGSLKAALRQGSGRWLDSDAFQLCLSAHTGVAGQCLYQFQFQCQCLYLRVNVNISINVNFSVCVSICFSVSAFLLPLSRHTHYICTHIPTNDASSDYVPSLFPHD